MPTPTRTPSGEKASRGVERVSHPRRATQHGSYAFRVRDFLLQAEGILNNSPAFDPSASTPKFRMLMPDYVETVAMTEALPIIRKRAPAATFELLSNAHPIRIIRVSCGLRSLKRSCWIGASMALALTSRQRYHRLTSVDL